MHCILLIAAYNIEHTFYLSIFQINELHHINVPVMLMPDDFKAFSKIKIDNHNFNK